MSVRSNEDDDDEFEDGEDQFEIGFEHRCRPLRRRVGYRREKKRKKHRREKMKMKMKGIRGEITEA